MEHGEVGNITVFLVDDHALVRAGFRRILDESGEFSVIGEAGDVAAALEGVARLQPAIVLMDISLPGRSGIDAIPSVCEAAPDCRIVMLSQYGRAQHVEDALRAGASGYLLKTATAEELMNGLRSALTVSATGSPESVRRILRDIPADASLQPAPELTTRESEVLRLVARGMSSKQIAVELKISPRTAETHRANLMSKLGCNGVADLVRFAVREGFVTP